MVKGTFSDFFTFLDTQENVKKVAKDIYLLYYTIGKPRASAIEWCFRKQQDSFSLEVISN